MVSRRTVGWILAGLAVLLAGSAGQAQTAVKALRNDEISVDGLYQFTSTVSGDGITDTASKSGGAEANFRHSMHWWLGYELGYTYARYTNFYTGKLFGYQNNMHDFSGAYYVHGPRAFGIQPFAVVGGSALLFAPSLNGGQNVPSQWRPGVNFGGGIDYPLLSRNFGLRLEYRGVYYQAPDFGQPGLTTNVWRITSEPMAGIYVHF